MAKKGQILERICLNSKVVMRVPRAEVLNRRNIMVLVLQYGGYNRTIKTYYNECHLLELKKYLIEYVLKSDLGGEFQLPKIMACREFCKVNKL